MKLYQTMYTGKVTLKSIEVMSLDSSAYEITCKLTYFSLLQFFYKYCMLVQSPQAVFGKTMKKGKQVDKGKQC